MSRRKVIFSAVGVMLVAALLAMSLTACLKIGMQEKNVRDRLVKAGAQTSYERTSPMTAGLSGYKIGDILLAKLAVVDNVDGEEVESLQSVYVFFTQDSRSADAVEKACKSYMEENSETLVRWNVYRHEEVIVCGHYKLVSIVRQY